MSNDLSSRVPSDATLTASGDLSVPRTKNDSFTLHAPLELLARADLLSDLSPEYVGRANDRIRELGARFAAAGDPIDLPSERTFAWTAEAWSAFDTAVASGDPDLGDEAAARLVAELSPATICARLAATTTRKLTAAAHAPILLANWPRVADRFDVDPAFVRHLVRNLCGALPDAEIPQPHHARRRGSLDELDAAVCEVDLLGSPGFGIFRLVNQAESSGLMADVPAVADTAIDDAFRVVMRAAARAMVLDDPEAAPYGWSHALTIPLGLWQANRHHGDAREALDMALTHAVAFRAGHGRIELPREYDPVDPGIDLDDALTAEPSVAAAAAFHRGTSAEGRATLLGEASIGVDAHLVKFAHACRDVALLDREQQRLYAAATAYLVAWWHHHPAHDVGS
jgi:hypothetical protein